VSAGEIWHHGSFERIAAPFAHRDATLRKIGDRAGGDAEQIGQCVSGHGVGHKPQYRWLAKVLRQPTVLQIIPARMKMPISTRKKTPVAATARNTSSRVRNCMARSILLASPHC
jgi:hypothetical protein